MMDTIVTIETTGKSEDTLKSTTDKAFAAMVLRTFMPSMKRQGRGPKKRPPTSLPS